MDRKRGAKAAFSKLAGCLIGCPASSSSSSRNVRGSSHEVIIIDEDNNQKRKKKEVKPGILNNPLHEVIQIDDDIPHSASKISKPLMPWRKDTDEPVLLNGEQKPEKSHSVQQFQGLLNPDDLSYLDLNGGHGHTVSSPTSTISIDSEQFYEDVDDSGDQEIFDIPEDNTVLLGDISGHPSKPSSSIGLGQPIIVIDDIEETREAFKDFKRFDIIVDHSDHHFVKVRPQSRSFFNLLPSKQKSATESQHPVSKEWTKQIQREWGILENDLPDTIYVRVYEERMDLLRAVIVGATGTPYHDGLFFFDISFPSDYPNSPPSVYYHSFGYRLNPNLYACGKVCLSLLNTWPGNRANSETWIPRKSTILQVLVSIQGLVLNDKPYFNEPGYEISAGKEYGERQSMTYNENTFILSLKTMLQLLRRPPMHFEPFVAEHFRLYSSRILEACNAYIRGAQVGSHVSSHAVQCGDQKHGRCSKSFYDALCHMIPQLVTAFINNGSGSDLKKYVTGMKEQPGTKTLTPVIF